MHHRRRHMLRVLSKRARVFPVLGVVGPRQVGKTTFLIQEWQPRSGAKFITLDKSDAVRRAQRAPEVFLLSESDDLKSRLIIDEAQKAPRLFDSIKALLDERRRIGRFTLSGSVEFSDRSGIRESLAGRLGVCRLYPMTLGELARKPLRSPWVRGWRQYAPDISHRDVELWLRRGGMPIFCSLHDEAEVQVALHGWLEALCYRDLQHLRGGRLDGDVAMSVLGALARDPVLNLSAIAHDAGVSRNSVQKHLTGLEALFLLYRLSSFDQRSAAPDCVLFDTALLHYFLGSQDDAFSRRQAMRTLLVNEILAQYEYSGEKRPGLFVYRSSGGSGIDLVLQDGKKTLGIQISIASDITAYALRGMKGFLKKHKTAEGVVLAPVTAPFKIDNIPILPWTHAG